MNIQGIEQSYSAYPSSYSSSGMQGMRGMQGGGFDPAGMSADKIIEKEDTNLDGVLSADETRLTADMFSDTDADGDGKISAEESILPDEVFSEIDTDQDGLITAEEIEKSRENKKEPPDRTQSLSSGSTMTQDMAIKAYRQAIQSFLLSYSGEGADSTTLTSLLNTMA